jgi:hypothetical protein
MLHTHLKKYVFLCCLVVSNLTIGADTAAIQSLIDEYGKNRIIDLILAERGSEISVDAHGYLQDAFGRPPQNKVNARSIARDLDKVGWGSKELASRLQQVLAQEKAAREREQKAAAATDHKDTNDAEKTAMDPYEADKFEHFCMQGCQTGTRACLDSTADPQSCAEYQNQCMMSCIEQLQ